MEDIGEIDCLDGNYRNNNYVLTSTNIGLVLSIALIVIGSYLLYKTF